jgi:hypothetical protein
LHWLPKALHRRILASLGTEYFSYLSREENLNLLTARELEGICADLRMECDVRKARLMGFASNLMLFIDKRA